MERLCAPVTLTNVTRLAECLGLDTSKYQVSRVGDGRGQQDDEIRPLDSMVPDQVRFAACKSLIFTCLSCRGTMKYRGLSEEGGTEVVGHGGVICPKCKTVMPNLTVVAQLEAQIRAVLARYYDGWLVCDDPSCGNRTRQISVYGHRCLGPRGLARGCLGKMQWELGESAVWNQLMLWERCWDVDRVKKDAAAQAGDLKEEVRVLAEVNRRRFETLRKVVKAYLDKSGRQWVDMGGLFGFAMK